MNLNKLLSKMKILLRNQGLVFFIEKLKIYLIEKILKDIPLNFLKLTIKTLY